MRPHCRHRLLECSRLHRALHASRRCCIGGRCRRTRCLQPQSCTPATCGCARIAAITASSNPASAADCMLLSSTHRVAARLQAASATRDPRHPTCARSAATARHEPHLRSYRLAARRRVVRRGPTHCRCRCPPASASPLSALTRRASGYRAAIAMCCCSCSFCATRACKPAHSACRCWF